MTFANISLRPCLKSCCVSRRPCFAGPSGSRCSPSILKAFFGISCKHDSSQAFRLRRLFSRRSSPRPISSSQLHALLHFHLCPIYLVVFKGSSILRSGDLILRGASRLDAFSVYPFPAWLLGCRPGGLTDAPAAGPSRSSRTKDSSSQISCARAG